MGVLGNIFETLSSLLNHPNPDVVIKTILALGDRVKDLTDYEPALTKLLNHPDSSVVIETIPALGDRVKDLPAETLSSLLNHPYSYVVIETIRALEGNLKKLASSGELNRLSASRDEGVKLAYQLAMISRF